MFITLTSKQDSSTFVLNLDWIITIAENEEGGTRFYTRPLQEGYEEEWYNAWESLDEVINIIKGLQR